MARAAASDAPRHNGGVATAPRAGVAANVAVSGVAVMCATTVTNPLDVVKVRMQTSARGRARARSWGRRSTSGEGRDWGRFGEGSRRR